MNPANLAQQIIQNKSNGLQNTTYPTNGGVAPSTSIPQNPEPFNPQAHLEALNMLKGDTQQSQGKVDYKELITKGFSPTQIESYANNSGIDITNAPDNWNKDIVQPTIIPDAAPLTETFGEIQPGVEVFSGGVTTGTGIGVKAGTPLALPPGQWKVVSTYDQAPQKGYIGNDAGQGWGNNIVVQNQQTGDSLRYSHLSEVNVAPGDTIAGNRIIGLSGQSGNTTGDHLNLQYIDPQGKPGDVLQTDYAKYLPIKK